MRKWLFVVGGLALGAQMLVSQKIAYPPSLEQLLFPFPVLVIRLLTVIILLVALYFWVKIASKYAEERMVDISTVLILISPIFWGLWLQYPLESLRYFLVLGWWYFLEKLRFNKRLVYFCTAIFFVIIIFFSNGKRLAILENMSISKAQTEVNLRFAKEDELSSKILLPLWERRLVNNKYSMVLRAGLRNLVSFWSLEPIFFQEFNPNSQKALVMFFWPGFLLLVVGLFGKFERRNGFWQFSLGLAYLNFLLLLPRENYEWAFCLFPVSLIMAKGLLALSKYKVILWLVIFFYGYAFQAFLYDISKRSDYWLDNRPIVYGNIFASLEGVNIQETDKVLVSDRIGGAKKYCQYFLKGKCDSNFYFSSFSLNDKEENSYKYLVGFEGEFLGKDINNFFSDEALQLISQKGFEIVDSYKIRDSIAYQYGNIVVIAKRK